MPRTNAEERPEVLAAFMRAHPLATLVSTGPAGELWATHLPVVHVPAAHGHGTIEGHVARANAHHRLVEAAARVSASPGESMVIFSGPDAYITPSWYAGKAVHGREVPTWNYIAVHAYGHLGLHDDPAWLMTHLSRLTDVHESGRVTPWAVSDAPDDYLAGQMRAIIGVELVITRIEARWKMSQNRTGEDIDRVVDGLSRSDRPMDRVVAEIVRERRPDRA